MTTAVGQPSYYEFEDRIISVAVCASELLVRGRGRARYIHEIILAHAVGMDARKRWGLSELGESQG